MDRKFEVTVNKVTKIEENIFMANNSEWKRLPDPMLCYFAHQDDSRASKAGPVALAMEGQLIF